MGLTLSNPLSSITGDGSRYCLEHPTNLNADQSSGPYDRAKAAIIGAFVADAVSVSSTYTRREDDNENDDDRVIRNFEHQEGISIPQIRGTITPDTLSVGSQSPYGDEAFPFLQLISTRFSRIFCNSVTCIAFSFTEYSYYIDYSALYCKKGILRSSRSP